MVVVGSARSTLQEGAFYARIATRARPVRVERVGSVEGAARAFVYPQFSYGRLGALSPRAPRLCGAGASAGKKRTMHHDVGGRNWVRACLRGHTRHHLRASAFARARRGGGAHPMQVAQLSPLLLFCMGVSGP